MWKHKNVLPLDYPQLSNSTFEFGEWFKPDNYLFIYSENFQIVMIIALLGLGEATLGLTRKEANVSGGIAITLFVVTFSISVFILNRFDVSLVKSYNTLIRPQWNYFSYFLLPIRFKMRHCQDKSSGGSLTLFYYFVFEKLNVFKIQVWKCSII